MTLKEALLTERKSEFENLKKNKVALTDDEKAECKKQKAVWNDGACAVWKSKKRDGSIVYISSTHRAYQVRNNLQASINIFHKFIKSTA